MKTTSMAKHETTKPCIVTLGMHRSGTSLLSGMLHTLRVDLGQAIMAPNPGNPKGYFENDQVMHLNNRVMDTMGFAWDDPFPWPNQWWRDERLAPSAIELSEIIAGEFNPDGLTGFKDPRISLLLPWWQACLTDLGFDCRYAIAIRHPLEVAASLAARNGFTPEKSVLLWMNHMLAAEKLTRGSLRSFVPYPDLLGKPIEIMRRIAAEIQLCGQHEVDEKEDKLRALADQDLRHHANAEGEAAACLDLALRVFDAMVEYARDNENPAQAKKFLRIMDEVGGAYAERQRWFCTREFHAAEVVARQLRRIDEKKQREERLKNTAKVFMNTGHGFNSRQGVEFILGPNTATITYDLSRFAGVQELRFDPGEDMVILHLNRITLVDQSGKTHELTPSRSNALMQINQDFYFETTDPQIFMPCPAHNPASLTVHLDFIARGRTSVEPLLANKRRTEMQALTTQSSHDRQKIGELSAQLAAASENRTRLEAQIAGQNNAIQQLEAQSSELHASLHTASDENNRLNQQIVDLRDELHDQSHSLKKLNHSKNILEKKHASLVAEKEAAGWKSMHRDLMLLMSKRDSYTQHIRQVIRIIEKLDKAVTRTLDSSAWRTGSKLVRMVEIIRRMPNQSQSPERFRRISAEYYSWKNDYQVKARQSVKNKELKQLDDGFSRGEIKNAVVNARVLRSRLLAEIDTFGSECIFLDSLYKKAAKQAASILKSYRWRIGYQFTIPLGYLRLRPKPIRADKILRVIEFYEEWNFTNRLNFNRRLIERGLTMSATKASPTAGEAPIETRAEAALLSEHPVVSLKRMNIVQFTPPKPRNPFYWMIGEQLRQRGLSYSYETSRDHLIDFLRSNRTSNNIIHFHQLDPLYHDRSGSLDKTRANSEELVSYLEMLKSEGAILIHTHHNPQPHHKLYQSIDEEVQMRVWKLFDQVVVLGQLARRAVRKHVPDEKISVINHPSFAGIYGSPIPRSRARERLKISPTNFVFGCLGEIKPYKGLEFMIEGFEKACRLINPAIRPELHIVGNPGPADYVKSISEMAPHNVFIKPERIADNDMAVWLGSFDAALFSLTGMWVSGSVILAASYGVPVVCPAIGCIPEYIDDENNGYLFRYGSVDDFADKVAMMCGSELMPHFKYMTRLFNERMHIQGIADSYTSLYKSLSV